jgi:hypothetical protein
MYKKQTEPVQVQSAGNQKLPQSSTVFWGFGVEDAVGLRVCPPVSLVFAQRYIFIEQMGHVPLEIPLHFTKKVPWK